jgi:hypothetical protein
VVAQELSVSFGRCRDKIFRRFIGLLSRFVCARFLEDLCVLDPDLLPGWRYDNEVWCFTFYQLSCRKISAQMMEAMKVPPFDFLLGVRYLSVRCGSHVSFPIRLADDNALPLSVSVSVNTTRSFRVDERPSELWSEFGDGMTG